MGHSYPGPRLPACCNLTSRAGMESIVVPVEEGAVVRDAIALITVVCSLSGGMAWTSPGLRSMTLNAEPLRIVLSKIAPLERWDASWSESSPKICWRLFRPSPQQLNELWQTIRSFQGRTQWYIVDNCLKAGAGRMFLASP